MKYDEKKIKKFRMLLTKILDSDPIVKRELIRKLSKTDKRLSLFIEEFLMASPEEQQRLFEYYDNYRDE